MTLIDVRSPSEYAKGHIPGAHNCPLLDDEERIEVGTLYKQVGRQEAVARGVERLAPKMERLLHTLREFEDELEIYCWRGGMRSEIMGKLAALAGCRAMVKPGGYRSYRREMAARFARPHPFRIIGGYTGAGKTAILEKLFARGVNVIDLEALANHRGSSYGARGSQPTQEHFENLLGHTLGQVVDGPIWIEDESRMIGRVKIPDPLFTQMMAAPTHVVIRPREERLARIVRDYANHDDLPGATERLRKRLGNERTDRAIALIAAEEMAQAFDLVLAYYDKAYAYGLERKRVDAAYLEGEGRTDDELAEVICAL